MKYQRMVVMCPKCNIQAGLRDAGDYALKMKEMGCARDRKVWVCSKCGAWTMAKKKAENFAPMGTLADEKLRAYRVKLHSMFDRLWRDGKMTRKMAYFNLAAKMKLDKEKCHIGQFDYAQCMQAEKCINELLVIFKVSCYNR